LVIYITLVRYVARLNRRRSRPAPRAKKQKADASAAAGAKSKPAAAAKTPKTDELGLEEDTTVEEE